MRRGRHTRTAAPFRCRQAESHGQAIERRIWMPSVELGIEAAILTGEYIVCATIESGECMVRSCCRIEIGYLE